jgi:hypothetical protein
MTHHRRGASQHLALMVVVAILLVARTGAADVVAFSGESLRQLAIHPLVDFGEGGRLSLLPHFAALVRAPAIGSEVLLLTPSSGKIRTANAFERDIFLRADDGRQNTLATWVETTGHIVLLESANEEVSPAAIARAHLSSRTGETAVLTPDGTTRSAPEPSLYFTLISGIALLFGLHKRRASVLGSTSD